MAERGNSGVPEPRQSDVAEEDEMHPTVRDCAMRSFCDATFEATERRMGEIDRLRDALGKAQQDIVEMLGAGFDSERVRIGRAAYDAITRTLDG